MGDHAFPEAGKRAIVQSGIFYTEKRLVYEYRLTYDTGRKENRAQKKAEYGFQKRKIAAQSHNQADHRSTYIT